MGFWLELLAEIFGQGIAEVIGNKTPRYIMLIVFVLIISILGGLIIYYLAL